MPRVELRTIFLFTDNRDDYGLLPKYTNVRPANLKMDELHSGYPNALGIAQDGDGEIMHYINDKGVSILRLPMVKNSCEFDLVIPKIGRILLTKESKLCFEYSHENCKREHTWDNVSSFDMNSEDFLIVIKDGKLQISNFPIVGCADLPNIRLLEIPSANSRNDYERIAMDKNGYMYVKRGGTTVDCYSPDFRTVEFAIAEPLKARFENSPGGDIAIVNNTLLVLKEEWLFVLEIIQ